MIRMPALGVASGCKDPPHREALGRGTAAAGGGGGVATLRHNPSVSASRCHLPMAFGHREDFLGEDVLRQTSKATVKKARGLRRVMTPPEVLLWQRLRGRPGGVKFRRQHPVGLMWPIFMRPMRG